MNKIIIYIFGRLLIGVIGVFLYFLIKYTIDGKFEQTNTEMIIILLCSLIGIGLLIYFVKRKNK